MTVHWERLAGGLLIAIAMVALAACSDSETDPTATATANATISAKATDEPSLSADFCSAVVAFEAIDEPGGEDSDEDYVAAIKDYADAIEAPFASMRASAPPELADSLDTLIGLLPRLHEGDTGAFEDPAAFTTLEGIQQVASDDCGWAPLNVTASDYHFELDRDTVPAGPVNIQLTNNGGEPHLFLLLRKRDGDSRELTDIVGDFLGKVSSGDPAQIAEVADEDVPGGGPFAAPGSSWSHVVELSSGTYIYWCPIPQGDSGDGTPHFALGMIGELTVE